MSIRKPKTARVVVANGVQFDIAQFDLEPDKNQRVAITWTENARDIDGRLVTRERTVPFFIRWEPSK